MALAAGSGGPRGVSSFLLAFLLEVFTHRRLAPLAAARTVVFHLDNNPRLFENTVRIHFQGRCSWPRVPMGSEVPPDHWRSWDPAGPLLPVLKAALDQASAQAAARVSARVPARAQTAA